MAELERQRTRIRRVPRNSRPGAMLALELDLAARMAVQSCRFMLWQQAVARKQFALAKSMSRRNVAQLRKLERDFHRYWPLRNKGDAAHCSPFLRWRIADYLNAGGSQVL